MKKTPTPHPISNPDEIAVQAFRQSEQQLQKLLGAKVDSIALQDGQQHLLRDAQEMLRQSEARFRNMFAAYGSNAIGGVINIITIQGPGHQ